MCLEYPSQRDPPKGCHASEWPLLSLWLSLGGGSVPDCFLPLSSPSAPSCISPIPSGLSSLLWVLILTLGLVKCDRVLQACVWNWGEGTRGKLTQGANKINDGEMPDRRQGKRGGIGVTRKRARTKCGDPRMQGSGTAGVLSAGLGHLLVFAACSSEPVWYCAQGFFLKDQEVEDTAGRIACTDVH